jgi:diketogulonate reductase-like aldo/keto reductase
MRRASVSLIGQGTRTSIVAIAMLSRHYAAGIELGMTHIDSAQMYGYGERVIPDVQRMHFARANRTGVKAIYLAGLTGTQENCDDKQRRQL